MLNVRTLYMKITCKAGVDFGVFNLDLMYLQLGPIIIGHFVTYEHY